MKKEDNTEIKSDLLYLGGLLTWSVLLYSYSFYSIFRGNFSILSKIKMASFVFFMMGLMFIQDKGSKNEDHGLYNILIFVVAFTTLNFLFYSCKFLFSLCPKYFCKIIGTLFMLALITIALLTMKYRELYSHGLLGKSALDTVDGMHVCKLDPAFPLPDFFYDGLLNFWTGSQTCPENKNKISWSISENGILTLNGCPKDLKLSFMMIPDTRNWHWYDKKLFEFAKKLEDFEKEIPYTHSTFIPDNVESIVVKCGTEKTLITRLVPHIPSFYNITTENKTIDENMHDQLKINGLQKPFNIALIFIDAVSRRQIQRKMKKTMRALESIHKPGKHRLYQFFRHSVAGFNTEPNTMLMYTGQPNIFYGVDRLFPPIWKTFNEQGYAVSWMTDDCDDWSSTTIAQSFSEYVSNEFEAPFCDDDYFSHTEHPFTNFKGPYSILRRCLYGDYVHNHALNFMDSMRKLYEPGGIGAKKAGREKNGVPFFMINSFIEGHEGTMEVLRTLDGDMAELLLKWERENVLDNTVLIMTSDHGSHMSLNYMITRNGWLENKNPFLFMVLPEWMVQQHDGAFDEALTHNEQVFTGHIDTYNTLSALIRWGTWDKVIDEKKTLSNVKEEKEIIKAKYFLNKSLFVKQEPMRKCFDMKIPYDECWCGNDI